MINRWGFLILKISPPGFTVAGRVPKSVVAVVPCGLGCQKSAATCPVSPSGDTQRVYLYKRTLTCTPLDAPVMIPH